jgi:hypothetical protein
MTGRTIHILNGDALAEQFPDQLKGEMIICRECLIEGPLKCSNLDEFWQMRSTYLLNQFDEPDIDYEKDTVSEMSRILALNETDEVNLWFEDDLFCQTNLWFICYLISNFTSVNDVHLVRSDSLIYGFAGTDLMSAWKQKMFLGASGLKHLNRCWQCYSEDNLDGLIQLSTDDRYPFLKEVIQAHIERIPSKNNPGRPVKSLQRIMKKLGSKDFGPVFNAFHEEEAIYGYGDLQVYQLYKMIIDRNDSSKS